MQSIQEDYNTQRELLKISEYGRSIQDYIQHIKTFESKEERTRWVEALVNIMAMLNPEIKKQSNYQEVLWGHVYQISDFSLDIDSPYPLPTEEEVQRKPAAIGYPDTVIRFRFYGRNLQNMIEKVTEIEDENLKEDLVNLIASYMYNSCKIWNDENLSNEVLAEHLSTLSRGKLRIAGTDLVVSADASKNVHKRNNNFNRNSNFRKNKKNNNRGKNYRRY